MNTHLFFESEGEFLECDRNTLFTAHLIAVRVPGDVVWDIRKNRYDGVLGVVSALYLNQLNQKVWERE